MSKITRETLMQQLKAVGGKIETLENKKYEYQVKRQFPGCVLIKDINNVNALIKCWETIHNGTISRRSAIEGLNLVKMGLINEENDKHLGYAMKEWENDLHLKAEELKDRETLEKLYKAQEILERNMSEDDKFAAEMDTVSELLD